MAVLIGATSGLGACSVHFPSVEAWSQAESQLAARMATTLDTLDPLLPALLDDPGYMSPSLTPDSGINVILGRENVTGEDVAGSTTLFELEQRSTDDVTAHLLVEGHGSAGGGITDASVGLYGCAAVTGSLREAMPSWGIEDEECPEWLVEVRARTQSRYTPTSVVAAIEASLGR